ncbi:CTP synthase [Mesomycoplasma flocculare]|uniref:CTP synthase (glutamine hydrolyzing) n=2 Tax=Mesomycoplasma flocculare TaxID=2128 RepID=A0A0A8E7A7_MESFC|nr:CTP synthase [Mesomycoplasma flocculare]MXR39601.1 CTP synthase [Mycoplasma sp. MF12]AJC49908.1 CTP synthetase [Mesomycoplasma flocculare ATCC 27399]ENX50879.1 CTP synthase [Mesomycoplasma flocculare ATCC 27716]MXR06005.1 CTP synthase [Mesomycoplasma flocculare]MXR12471.1 CTP synthase [Mesomycoplasma flocculare]
MAKFIFVTGGVLSGIGKGVSVASVANLLKSCGYSVYILKLDPYLNVDPGVLSPYEHGEVFVTADGGETDLDLGHYERFVDQNFSKDSNHTSGKILLSIIEKERKGFYQGKTVQIIPHVIDEIIFRIKKVAKKYQSDFVLVEIGGTVGDMESNPFYFAASQMAAESSFKDVFFIHTTYIPFLSASGEFKTKPAQFSIAKLNSRGIRANAIFLRLESEKVEIKIAQKVAKSAFLALENIITIPNLENIYQLPLLLEQTDLLKSIFSHFQLELRQPKLEKWKEFTALLLKKWEKTLKIAALGKYTQFLDAYKSIIEAFKISAAHQKVNLELKFIDTTEENFRVDKLKNFHGIIILPGFGFRGFEKKVEAATFTYKNNIPTIGICLGMQVMTIALARLNGIKNAHSAEFLAEKPDQTSVLDYNQIDGSKLQIGGTLRLGNHQVLFAKNSKIAKIYGKNSAFERHRHRFEVVKKYLNKLENQDFIFSARDAKTDLIEVCESKTHIFYIGVQYHPEFITRPLNPHPLFNSFLSTIIENIS